MAAITPITNAATVPDLWDNAFKTLKEEDKQNVDFQRTDKRAILEDVLVEVQKKKQDCLTRRLKYKRSNGDSVHIYDVCEKIVNWVNKFKEIGDAAMQYDPGHAALPWAAIRFFLQVSVNDVQIWGSLVEGLEIVSKTVAHYAVIEKLYLRQLSSVDKMLEDSVTATYASILRFLSKCRRHFDRGLAQRLASSVLQLPENSVMKHLDRIAQNDRRVKELTSTIDAEWSQRTLAQQITASDGVVQLVHGLGELRMESTQSASKLEALLTNFNEPIIRTMNQVSTMSDRLVDIRNESQLKKDRLTILKWLSDVQYRKHHQTLSKALLEGTGTWLLNKREYVEWRNSSVSSVLWLHGIPGSGKTYLMANVVKQLLAERSTYQNAAPVAYFYCQRNTAEIQRSNPTEVLRAILKQIVLYKADWESDSPAAKEYKRRREEADKDGSDVECLDLLETTEQITDAVAEMPVTIIIDALDECHPDQRPQLLKALDLLLEKSAHLVKVFVSSRDDIDIVLKLQKHPNIYINIDDNKQDINRFIHSEIGKAQIEGRLLKGMVSPRLQYSVTNSLAEKAQGMFLWVNLQIQNLCDSRRIKVEEDLLQELTKLPKDLTGMYCIMLGNVRQIEQHGRNVAETALKWLLCTRDSSSETIIAACSATDLTEPRTLSIHDVLDVCSNMVVYDEALDEFRFAHLSVREFLESQPSYTSSEVNLSVARTTLQCLFSTRPECLNRLQQYATRNWTYHYQNLGEQPRKDFFEKFAKRFFFNGAGFSEIYSTWAVRLGSGRNMPFCRRDRLEVWPYIVINPVLLACCSGWVEILDHYETYQSSDGFSESATEMMNVAIRYNSASAVRWLLARKIDPTNEQFEFVVTRQPRLLHIFYELISTKSLSISTLVYCKELLVKELLVKELLVKELFVSAVHHAHAEDYRLLIEPGICCQDPDVLTLFPLLSHAISSCYRNLDSMEALLLKGMKPGARENPGQTPLSLAMRNYDIMEDLLLKAMNPVAREDPGQIPLSLAIWGEHQQNCSSLAGLLLGRSETLDRKDLLRRMLKSSYCHHAYLLLRHGLVSMLDDVLVRAEWMGALESIATVPNLHTDTLASVTERSGKLHDELIYQKQLAAQTLLSLAALHRHEKAFRVLLGWGTDPTCQAIRDSQKKASTVTHMGNSMSGQQIEGLERTRNANKEIDELRLAPLAWAAYTGNLSLVQSILDQDMDPNIHNRRGQAPLYFAVQKVEDRYSRIDLGADKEAIVRLLLRKGAVVTSADAYDGATVLAHAFLARYSEMAHILIGRGAQVPKGVICGPVKQLWDAFEHGREGIYEALLERVQAAEANSLDLQPPISYGDPVGIAAQLILGGTMRLLGNAILAACGDINDPT